jgi:hypothetical protein
LIVVVPSLPSSSHIAPEVQRLPLPLSPSLSLSFFLSLSLVRHTQTQFFFINHVLGLPRSHKPKAQNTNTPISTSIATESASGAGAPPLINPLFIILLRSLLLSFEKVFSLLT